MRAEKDAVGLLLAQFGLTTMAREFERVEEQAAQEGWSLRQTLRELLEMEVCARRERRLVRLLEDSQLPEGKTHAALESSRLSAANRRHLAELCEGHFAERAVNVLAFGLPGRGKTHFLSAVGYELIQRHGKRVLFVPTFKLIQRLLEAKRELGLEAALERLDQYDVVILDDLGYVQQSRDEPSGANRGRDGALGCATPTSEPDVRISRIRLSSQRVTPRRRLAVSFSRASSRQKRPRSRK